MNVELAEAAIAAAERAPERFNMDTWTSAGDEFTSSFVTTGEMLPPCGTTACMAGFAALATLPKGTIVAGGFIYSSIAELTADILDDPDFGPYLVGHTTSGRVDEIGRVALGITVDQADALFYLEDLSQVKRAVAFLKANPDATEEEINVAAGDPEDDDDDA